VQGERGKAAARSHGQDTKVADTPVKEGTARICTVQE